MRVGTTCSWQVTAVLLGELMTSGDRVMRAFLPMKRFDVAKIEAAGRGGVANARPDNRAAP